MSRQNGSHYDVIIVGGGPAGSTAGTFLAQAGHRVLILERENFPRFHIGESLLPATWEIWQRLGFVEKMMNNFVTKPGVLFSIHNNEENLFSMVEARDLLYRPYAFHVRRSEYDQLLLEHARENGAEVWLESTVKNVLFNGQRAEGVVVSRKNGQELRLTASVIVDATGRETLLARKLGLLRPDPTLNKVAYFTHYTGAYNMGATEAVPTYIFGLEGAWLWYIPMKDDVTSVGVVMDMNHPRHRQRESSTALLADFVDDCPTISKWLQDATPVEKVRGIPNISYINERFAGDGFVMIGDAAMFVDPIFSSGVYLAMRSAQIAADTIHQAFEKGDFSQAFLSSYEQGIREHQKNIFAMIRNWYKLLESESPEIAVKSFNRVARSPLLRRNFLLTVIAGLYNRGEIVSLLET
jgi:halogenation protein CepH